MKKEYQKEWHKKYYQIHKEELKERQKCYNKEHKENKHEYDKSYAKTKIGRAYKLLSDYRRWDSYKGLECTLTKNWIIDNVFSGQICHWCGETDWQKLGCDRIDNSKPHTPDNVVPSCWDCNRKRNNASYDFFKMMCTPDVIEIKLDR